MRTRPGGVQFAALVLRPGGAGVPTYARELIRAVAATTPAVPLSATVQRDALAELPASVRPVVRPVAAGSVRAVLGALPVRGVDLVHGLDVDLPVATTAARVATVHDLSVFDTPWAFPRHRVLGEQLLVRHSLRVADVLVAVSGFTADRIRQRFGRTAEVTHLAPGSWARPATPEQIEDLRRRLGLPERFVLQVGTVEPRKDVALLAAAARSVDLPCVLAGSGSQGPDAPPGALGLGYVAQDDLPALYGAATVVGYASRYEGFGLPPVEAMACGAVVVASAVGALPEVVTDGAVLVGTHELDAWSAALGRVVRDADLRAALQERAVVEAGRLSWAGTAEGTLRAYRQAGLAL